MKPVVHAEEFALIDEIVRELPCEVEDFFRDVGMQFWTDSQGAGLVQLFGMFVAHYLKSTSNAEDVVSKIMANKNAEAYWRAKSIPSAAAVRLAGLGQNP